MSTDFLKSGLTLKTSLKKLLFSKAIFIIVVALFSIITIVARRPDSLTNPQFWAEDGVLWYGQAYNLGWLNSFFIPITGYYQTLSRIGGSIAQFFPLSHAPFIFNIIAIFILFTPILILISSYFGKAFPNMFIRIFIVIGYLILPNISEVYINLTNAQWFLAFTGLLALLFLPVESYFWLDIILFALVGLSGPFSLLLLPIVYLYYRKSFSNKKIILFGIILLTGMVQLITLLTSGGRTFSLPTDASPTLLLGIFYKQIVWGSLVGPNGYQWFIDKLPFYSYFFIISGLLAISLLIYCIFRAPKEIKLMILFGILIFITGLLFPVLGAQKNPNPWTFLFTVWGVRYWLIPMMVFLISLTWTATNESTNKIMKLISISFLMCMIIFQIKNYRFYDNFKYPQYTDLHFQQYAQQFSELKKGEQITIPINPPEPRWRLRLIKH